MVGKLIETAYSYKDVTLATSGVVFSGNVILREGKVFRTIGSIACKLGDEKFSFALNQPDLYEEDIEGYKKPRFSTPNWPSELSTDATVKEFTDFIEKDIE